MAAPTYSFKNADDAALNANDPAQQKQMQKFASLLEQARTAGRKAIVVTHVPNVDDPFELAKTRYTGAPKREMKVEGRSTSSAWNVTKTVIDAWKAAVSSDVVAAVLAGHLHDSHREIYRQPYAWSTADQFADDSSKLFLTPPLSIKNQDTSPAQARGFSLIHLQPDRVGRSLYWYEPEAKTFTAEQDLAGRNTETKDGFWRTLLKGRGLRWFWRLSNDSPLNRLAVLLIAFLVAFLTVARVWQIPPADTRVVVVKSGDASSTDFDPSPFKGPLGATVVAGLGGLVAETVVKALSSSSAKNDTEFYVVWFVLFFFAFLVIAASVQGLLEAFRTRVSIVRFSRVTPQDGKFWPSANYWARRFLEWVGSWRYPVIIFIDTISQRMQGKNQTQTKVFSETIEADQANIVRVADAIRTELNELLNRRIAFLRGSNVLPPEPGDIRVNISVMAADQSAVSYIATAPRSAPKRFPKRSLAWVSVFAQQIRWYKKSYRNNEETFSQIVLFDNSSQLIADDEKDIFLKSHYQGRADDYEAFVMFPIPGSRRDLPEQKVQGAIHISFRSLDDFERLWKIGQPPETTDPKKVADPKRLYESFEKILVSTKQDGWCDDAPTCDAIGTAIRVLSELLKGFNENVYTTLPRPVGTPVSR